MLKEQVIILKENAALYKASVKGLKDTLAKNATQRAQIVSLFDSRID